MAKKIFPVFVSVLMVLSLAGSASAQFGLQQSGQKAGYGETDIYVVISTTISIVLSLAGLAFLAIMLWAGIRWMTARGNEEFISKAKDAMFAGIIGFILVTISYGLSSFIFSRLIK